MIFKASHNDDTQSRTKSVLYVFFVRYSIHEEHDLPPSQYGRIWFSLVYDGAVEALTIKVIKVRLMGTNDEVRILISKQS